MNYAEIIKVFESFGITGCEVICNPIEVSSYDNNYPDPDWRFTDGRGHSHWRSKKEDNPYPTLIWIVDDPGYDGDDDYYCPPRGHYECVICGEHIEPGFKNKGQIKAFVQGPCSSRIYYTRCGIKDYIPVSRDEMEKIQFLMGEKYDYQFTKLRGLLTEIMKRGRIFNLDKVGQKT